MCGVLGRHSHRAHRHTAGGGGGRPQAEHFIFHPSRGPATSPPPSPAAQAETHSRCSSTTATHRGQLPPVLGPAGWDLGPGLGF